MIKFDPVAVISNRDIDQDELVLILRDGTALSVSTETLWGATIADLLKAPYALEILADTDTEGYGIRVYVMC